MKRVDFVIVVVSGDYGKPRPALVVQSDAFDNLPSVTVLRLSSEIQSAPLTRITVMPNADNGLRVISQIMIDKAIAVPREKVRLVVGRIDIETLSAVDRALCVFLGLRA